MKRRRKMLVAFLSVSFVLILAFVIWDGALMPTQYDLTKDIYDEEKSMMSETEFILIKAGLQAGSSHNMQPWKVRIVDRQTFELIADMSKTLPVIDPENKQLLMSQGTFIGAVKKIASERGIGLEVVYQPIDLTQNQPLMATFKIQNEANPLIDAMTSATQGTVSKDKDLETGKMSEMMAPILPEFNPVWVNVSQNTKFKEYLKRGTIIESENQQAMEELLSVFRFTKWSKNKNRFGLSLNTMAPPMRMFIEPILGLTAEWKSFGQSSIATFETRLKAEESYLVLETESPKPLDYIRVGEALSVLNLNVQGYTIRPAVQLLQPLEGIKALYDSFKKELGIQGDVVQIIGFTKKTASYHESVRHKVMDIIQK